ncbi:hypothetical protein C1645_840679 [Glomus cerebriforme]|uniref:Uncharacterized protein n=1 Tax=Glomus cerebriforme TaxID=658196 RepID=A0A397S9P5_9GLOM|nr:hypothetical protein C1645_840679 [Glomus cerebriforme]
MDIQQFSLKPYNIDYKNETLLEVVGEKNMCHVDYALEELIICITEGKQYQIAIGFSQTALEEGLEDEKELCKNVKWMMEVIVRLLRERIDVKKKLTIKKQQAQSRS